MIGIDFGAKQAGTTVLAYWDQQEIAAVQLFSSQKGQDGDAFVREVVNRFPEQEVFLDAPLSLPRVYRNPEGATDYFFREADKAVRAMSPMFLGGLTARAMQVRRQLEAEGHCVCECYPGALARSWNLKDLGYKGKKADLPACLEELARRAPFTLPEEVPSWHAYDALLALTIGTRKLAGTAVCEGNAEEGQLWY